jgi:hypothetical protein
MIKIPEDRLFTDIQSGCQEAIDILKSRDNIKEFEEHRDEWECNTGAKNSRGWNTGEGHYGDYNTGNGNYEVNKII